MTQTQTMEHAPSGAMSWQQELKALERSTGVSMAEMKSPCRQRAITRVRWEAWAILRARGWSLPRIGALFNRDHTTVMYGLAERAKRQAGDDAARHAGAFVQGRA